MKNKLKNFLALMIGLAVSFLIAEIILRLYDPFGFRQRADRIVLQPNAKYTLRNDQFAKLDTFILHTKNSMGFRGPEKPADFDNWISIITVGGSTTECYYLSDGKDWTALLNKKLDQVVEKVWINNAGIDGHSTFGHSILLRDYISPIKPDYVIFLVGCNEIGREDLNEPKKIDYNLHLFGWKSYLRNHSEVINLLVNLKRNFEARRRGLVHSPFDLSTSEVLEKLDTAKIQATINFHRTHFLTAYKDRLDKLIDLTRASHIIPVLVTQPTLTGTGTDDITKIDLERVKICNHLGGKADWLITEEYNEVTRKVAGEKDILLVDLAHKMPKSSGYFYDCIHFTNEGSELVAQILFEELKTYIKRGM